MNVTKENAAIIGVGAVACAACCAGPIIGVLAAIGLGTATGIVFSGLLGVAIAAIGASIVLRRRRRKSNACSALCPGPTYGRNVTDDHEDHRDRQAAIRIDL